MDYEIRKINRKDKNNWISLYCGYAKFYNVPMNQKIIQFLIFKLLTIKNTYYISNDN